MRGLDNNCRPPYNDPGKSHKAIENIMIVKKLL